MGGGLWLGARRDGSRHGWGAGGLVGLLVLIAAIALLCTGRFPDLLVRQQSHEEVACHRSLSLAIELPSLRGLRPPSQRDQAAPVVSLVNASM